MTMMMSASEHGLFKADMLALVAALDECVACTPAHELDVAYNTILNEHAGE